MLSSIFNSFPFAEEKICWRYSSFSRQYFYVYRVKILAVALLVKFAAGDTIFQSV